MRPGGFAPRRPGWPFWRGVALGFLAGCTVGYALLRTTSALRVHQIDPAPGYVVTSIVA